MVINLAIFTPVKIKKKHSIPWGLPVGRELWKKVLISFMPLGKKATAKKP